MSIIDFLCFLGVVIISSFLFFKFAKYKNSLNCN